MSIKFKLCEFRLGPEFKKKKICEDIFESLWDN